MTTSAFSDMLVRGSLPKKLAELQRVLRRTKIKGRVPRGLLVLMLLCVMSSGGRPAVTEAAGDNPIVLENQQPGSNGWMWSGPFANDVSQQIKGYASATSVNQNETITFYVTVNPAQTYTIDISRIGWY